MISKYQKQYIQIFLAYDLRLIASLQENYICEGITFPIESAKYEDAGTYKCYTDHKRGHEGIFNVEVQGNIRYQISQSYYPSHRIFVYILVIDTQF